MWIEFHSATFTGSDGRVPGTSWSGWASRVSRRTR